MINQDIIFAKNIIEILKDKHIKQSKLAERLNLPRQAVNKMLNGSRSISAIELKKIALILDTTMDKLCKITEDNNQTNVLRNLVDKVDDERTKETILIADELINMILFHRKAADKITDDSIGYKL